MQQIHYKKNELQEVEFYADKECTEAFDFTNAKDLYIGLRDGDITPLTAISDEIRRNANIHTPYIPQNQKPLPDNIKTLDDITPNLSKYIPEDNAVLFLSEDDYDKYRNCFTQKPAELFSHYIPLKVKYTIFLPHGTQSELQKAEEVAKELMEKYGVEEVNLCALHFFVEKKHIIKTLRPSRADRMYNNEIYGYEMKKICKNINKIITTNSTGILPVQDTERLQVIDSKEIFEEYLKTER